MSKTIKIGSSNFWGDFKLEDSFFYDLIVMCGYEPIINNNTPDILFCSIFGNNNIKNSKPIKIWFTGENWSLPDFNQYHYALSGYFIDNSKHYRLPLYVLYAREYIKHSNYLKDYDQLSQPRNLSQIKPKTKFCNFVYSNCDSNREGTKLRQEFFHKLSQYKQVDAGGSCLNNIGYKIPEKLPFMSDYKFTISMENSNVCNGIYGYTTEKIFEPMLVDSIPIYWGNPEINKEFNQKSIISYHDFNDIDELIETIIKIDNDDNLYNQYLSEPFVLDYEKSPLNINNLITYFKTNILNEC